MLKPAENIVLSVGLVWFVVFTTGCSSNKYLQPGQTFLESNSVKISSKERVQNKAVLRSDLEKVYLQEETRVFIGIPRHWFYYQAQEEPDDTTGFRRLWRKIGDEPVITDSSLIRRTVDNMEQYLTQRGYWNGEVDFQVRTDDARSRVTYLVDPMQQWTVSSIRYVSDDTTVQRILDTLLHESLLSPGAPVDVELYSAERARVTRALQNRGYAFFFQNYITEPIADTSRFEMDLEIEVTTPADAESHQKYRIGEIIVYPDATAGESTLRDTVVNGITFRLPGPPKVRPEVVTRNIYLDRGSLYSRDAYDKTLQQLGRLEAYRFVTLKPQIDPADSTVLNYRLDIIRNKKMEVGGEIELNYSSVGSRSLIGVGGNLNFRNRNIFKGAELFSTNVEAGVELNIGRGRISTINSANIVVQNSLLIPKFIDPLGFYAFLNRTRYGKNGLLGDQTMEWLSEGNTSVSAGYQYLSLFNLYDYHSMTARLGYDAQPDAQRRLQLTHMGIDFFNPRTKPAFDTILDENVFLRESFRKQLFTGLLFRDFRYTYTGKPRLHRSHVAVIYTGELSGLEVFGLNTLYNAIANRQSAFELGRANPLSFSHFGRFEIDSRLYHILSSTQQLALRFSTGIAIPYGPFTRQVPYIKQFYVGGPSSIRAWEIRQLGPGGYQDLNVNPALPYYQTGDVKLELSGEYRFDIAWIFEGALFLDAGNVWTIQTDASRPGAVFRTSDFLKQIAVGTGFGVRLDFTYFRIRLDFGYKLRNPYPDEAGDYWLFKNFRNFSFNQITTNFAIGYPF